MYVQLKGILRVKPYIQGFIPSSLDMLSDLAWGKRFRSRPLAASKGGVIGSTRRALLLRKEKLPA